MRKMTVQVSSANLDCSGRPDEQKVNQSHFIDDPKFPPKNYSEVYQFLGFHTGPIDVFWAHFVLVILQLFHFHTWEPILIIPEGQ